jgi:hypothetical protein
MKKNHAIGESPLSYHFPKQDRRIARGFAYPTIAILWYSSRNLILFGRISMITGAHVIIYTKNPEADREFFRDVLGFRWVDAGQGWLIFALPSSEAAFHPADRNGAYELYLMCDDLEGEMKSLRARGVECSEINQERWGSITRVMLPGGGSLGLYRPKHPIAITRS